MAHWLLIPIALLLVGCRTAPLTGAPGPGHGHEQEEQGHVPAEHGHQSGHAERPAPLGRNLTCAWCAPVDPAHESRCGVPYVHAFHVEPAFLGRDVLVHVEQEGDLHALEVELEYALTRRLLVVTEVPFHWTDDEDGVGDVGLGLRGLLVETNRVLLSAQVAVEWPTAEDGLGADEVLVAPSLLAWGDLGRWFAAQAGVSLEVGTESEDTELSWGAALSKSFARRPLLPCGHGAHDHASWLSLLLEGRGTYALAGSEEGATSHEALFGISLPITHGLDARAGWNLRWDAEDDAASGWVLGFVLHL